MANKEETKATEIEAKKQAPKQTLCYVVSKANYTIPIKCDGQQYFIQPFGRVKAIKELVIADADDAKFLSFAKI